MSVGRLDTVTESITNCSDEISKELINARQHKCLLERIGYMFCAGDKMENEMGWACGAYG